LGLDVEGIGGAIVRLLHDEPEFPRALPEAPRPKY
jgi:hypothetical protein